MPTNFALFEKINFFIHLRIPRLIVNRYTLQVSRTLKTQPSKQALGSSGQKRERGAREGDTRGVRELPLPSRVFSPLARFFLCLDFQAPATQAIANREGFSIGPQIQPIFLPFLNFSKLFF